MREYGGDILYVLKVKIWLRSDSISKSSSLHRGHCLATTAFIQIFICDVMYCDGSIAIMWNLNLFINGFPLPSRRVKHQSCQEVRL